MLVPMTILGSELSFSTRAYDQRMDLAMQLVSDPAVCRRHRFGCLECPFDIYNGSLDLILLCLRSTNVKNETHKIRLHSHLTQ